MFKLRKNAIIEEYVHLFIFKMGGQHASMYLIQVPIRCLINQYCNFISGIVRERATWCYPVFHIFDSLGSAILKVRGPMFHFGTCGENVPFDVISQENGGQVATITKLWGGCCRDAVLDADNFVIEFLLNTSVEEKALVIATAFLIDLMYFENSG